MLYSSWTLGVMPTKAWRRAVEGSVVSRLMGSSIEEVGCSLR